MNVGLCILGSILGSICTLTYASGQYGEKISALERIALNKADAAAVAELATKSDVRALGDLFKGKMDLHERRDDEQDRTITDVRKTQSEQDRLLRRIETKLDVLVAISDPDGRVSRAVGVRQ